MTSRGLFQPSISGMDGWIDACNHLDEIFCVYIQRKYKLEGMNNPLLPRPLYRSWSMWDIIGLFNL